MVWSYSIGAVATILGVILIIGMCCWGSAVQDTIEAIQDGTKVLTAMPTLILQPICQLVMKLTAFIFIIWGFMWIMSMAKLELTMPNPLLNMTNMGKGETQELRMDGLGRRLEFS